MMKKQINTLLTITLLLCTLLFVSCGDDDGAAPADTSLASLNSLAGDWIDETVAQGSDDSGFIVINFDIADLSATVYAASGNDAGVSCETILFRNIEPSGPGTFEAEGFINLGFGAEYIPVILTIVDENTINATWECTGCTPGIDILTKLPDRASIPVEINSTIDQETILTNITCDPNVADYIITAFIDVRQLLTIEPGVIIEFGANAGLNIAMFSDGVISAEGTSSDPITFTGETKTAGFWRGINVGTNDVRNVFDHVIIEYAGSDPMADDIRGGTKGGLVANAEPGTFSSLSITNSTIRNIDGYGLIIEWISVLRNFSENTFQNNTNAAAIMEAPNVEELDATSSYSGGNGYEGVEIFGASAGNELAQDATWTNFDDGSAYLISRSMNIEATLTILPGATFEFEANETMYFKQDFSGPNDGIIIAKGTASEPITFTGVTKTPGYWRGLVIQSNSLLNEIDNCIVEYGGSDIVASGQLGNIIIDKDGAFTDPDLIVTNSTIRHSAGCGIVVDSFGGNLTQSGNTFTDNVGADTCN